MLLPIDAAISPEAIQQQEVVVEAKAKSNTEASMLAARRKASSVGDAVSAEQVRKSPDKDAAEVLRRVTGLSVQDNKYVYVRGLGERYSSTEVDGVRIASPEQNKRVVPLDLVPATLLENIVVQKSYTADRPGEFGGGDVQVRTKDFPGARTWSFSAALGANQGVTFRDHATYQGSRADFFGFGSSARGIPQQVSNLAAVGRCQFGNPRFGPYFTKAQLADVAKSFSDVWSPYHGPTPPNSAFTAGYGDEVSLFGRPLGLVTSLALRRSTMSLRDMNVCSAPERTRLRLRRRAHRRNPSCLAASAASATASPRPLVPSARPLHQQCRRRSAQLHRPGPQPHQWRDRHLARALRHPAHVSRAHRGVRRRGRPAPVLAWNRHRSRLEADALSRQRQQPDRREYIYDHHYSYTAHWQLFDYWALGSLGSREYGDLNEDG